MPAAITKEQKREAVRLRIDENLSTPAIARAVRICNHSAYRILKNYPWDRPRKAVRGKLWTGEDNATLRALWPAAEPDEIMKALPGRSWHAITRQASTLKVRRRAPGSRRNTRAIHPTLQELRAIRERAAMTRPDLAKKIGYHINQILAWELGKARPGFSHVVDWANALGYELALQPKGFAEVIAFPSRKKLMGVR